MKKVEKSFQKSVDNYEIMCYYIDTAKGIPEQGKEKQRMFKCSHCGKVFEEVEKYKDGHDTWCCCPACGFDGYEEAVKCEVCGEWFTEDELFFGVCEDCKNNLVEEYRYKPLECYKLEGAEKETVAINSLFVSLFTPEQIESALLRVIMEADGYFNIDCSDFIKSDIAWFIESAKGVK